MKTEVKLSRRGENAPASPIRRLVPFADAARASGAHVYHLNIGQPDIETPVEMLNAYRSFTGPVLAYGPSAGIQEYRQAVANYWKQFNVEISADEILATTGGSEAINFAMLAICDPGDEILVPEPFYTNYLGFAEAASVKIVPLPTSVENGFRLPSRETIEAAISERTRGIMYSNPGNPTGVVYTREEMQLLGDIAAAHGLYLLADEVYREFVYEGAEFTSAFHLEGLDDRVIVLDSVSKRFSACGARVGYLATRNKDVIESAICYGQARLCPPTVDQIAAAAAFSAPPSYLEKVLEEYGKRRNVLHEELQKIPGVTAHKPAGAFYAVCKLPVKDAEAFAIWLLTDFRVDGKTVMVAPANGFYATPGKGLDEVRIAYVLNVDDLRASMDILRQGLEAYTD
ncbi:pyridoxal phosphate-dependent aminotransferase [bacterium]|nr:pyridoxal phosphate-dependent aminotransferase [bacterium]